MRKTRPKNCTIKPPFTLTVLCVKIQGATALCPQLRTPMHTATNACCRLIAVQDLIFAIFLFYSQFLKLMAYIRGGATEGGDWEETVPPTPHKGHFCKSSKTAEKILGYGGG